MYFVKDLNHWTVGWVEWNLAILLDGKWPGWSPFSSPIYIDAKVKEYYKQPTFYSLGHFSKFIVPDSVRIGVQPQPSHDPYFLVTAMKRPDNAIVVVVLNLHENEYEFTINDPKMGNLVHKISGNAIQTYIWWE